MRGGSSYDGRWGVSSYDKVVRSDSSYDGRG